MIHLHPNHTTPKKNRLGTWLLLPFLFIPLLMLGCSSTPQTVNTDSLTSLENINGNQIDPGPVEVNNLRSEQLKDTALTFGAQSALAYYSSLINHSLEDDAIHLRSVFNFSALLLDHNVQPPVLLTSHNSVNYSSPDVLRISDKTYKIYQQARFVTTTPTWQNYLITHYRKPELPHKSLLPRTKAEQAIWRKWVKVGWEQGQQQAQVIFAENLERLKRDYNGMLLYRSLLARHMISKPFVAKTDLGVTGDGNAIEINDQVLRITAVSQLQTDSKAWKPILVDG